MIVLFSVVLALAVALFLFGALAATLFELLAAAFSLRGQHLRQTLWEVLGDLTKPFLQHPFYRQIARQHQGIWNKRGLPEKLHKRTFGLILLDILGLERGKDPFEVLMALPEGDTKQMLLFLGRQSGYNLDRLRILVENWWEEVSRAGTAQYRRKAQGALFFIGCLLAFVFNADFFGMYESFSRFALQSLEATFLGEDSGKMVRFFGWNTEGWSPWLLKIAGFLLTGLGIAFCAPVWYDWVKKWLYRRGGQIWDDHADDSLAEAIATGLELEAAKSAYKNTEPEGDDPYEQSPFVRQETERSGTRHYVTEDASSPPPLFDMSFHAHEEQDVSPVPSKEPFSPVDLREMPDVVPSAADINHTADMERQAADAHLPDQQETETGDPTAQTEATACSATEPSLHDPPMLPTDFRKLNWALRSSPLVEAWWEKENLRGQEMRIALLGTGVFSAHPDLDGAIADTFAFEDTDAEEPYTHLGTQAALLIAGRGRFSYGVAPEAQLLIGKIGKNERDIRPEGLIAGIEWALSMKADVVAMLTDFREMPLKEQERMKELIQQAAVQQTFLLAPVGNSMAAKPETRFPAVLDGVLCVGAHGPAGRRSSFSARSYHLDLLAPGEDLLIPDADGQVRLNLRDTALATAYAAGIVALLKQRSQAQGQPFDPETLTTYLRSTAVPHTALTKGSDVEYGYGILSVLEK
jgi:subtilisin family serine protease